VRDRQGDRGPAHAGQPDQRDQVGHVQQGGHGGHVVGPSDQRRHRTQVDADGGPAARGGGEARPLGRPQAQRRGEQLDRGPLRPQRPGRLEIAQRAHADPGPGREFLLRQPGRTPQLTEQGGEWWSVRHEVEA
jgi:hypothetical protein